MKTYSPLKLMSGMCLRYSIRVRSNTRLRHVHIDGSGDQVIVFLHGFMSSKNYWRRVIKQLNPNDYTAISIDLLGFGKAPMPDSAYTYNDHVEYIRSVILDLGLDNVSIVMAGHSMGALIASRYINTYPTHVKAAGFINPPIYITPKQAQSTILATGLHYRFLLTSKYRGLLWAAGRQARILPAHSADSREKSLQSIVVAAEFLDDMAKSPVQSLLTIGTKDRWLYQENIALSKALNSQVRVRIDETGHHAALTHPTLVAGYIKDLAS